MFSVFHNEEGEFKFRTLLLNGEKDIFTVKALATMGWAVADVKVHLYSSPKLLVFTQWMNDRQKFNLLRVDPISYDLQKVVRTKAHIKKVLVLDTDADALNYYTQAEIDSFAAIKVILDQWNIDNPNPDNDTINPDFGVIVSPDYKFKDQAVAESFEIVDSIAGTLVDVPARIILEDAAIAANKKQLD